MATLLAGAIALPLAAEEPDVGRREYLNACAICHGESGNGEGALADLLTVAVPGLTAITAQNGGTFPMLDIIHIIDGRTGLRGHGSEMPVWGAMFRNSIPEEAGLYSSELIVRGRVLAIAEYLRSIQED
ncbi:MAG: cytochrome c [Litoreibacter sp.]|nr:cytochrome c [Litoreibacter sp.]